MEVEAFCVGVGRRWLNKEKIEVERRAWEEEWKERKKGDGEERRMRIFGEEREKEGAG